MCYPAGPAIVIFYAGPSGGRVRLNKSVNLFLEAWLAATDTIVPPSSVTERIAAEYGGSTSSPSRATTTSETSILTAG